MSAPYRSPVRYSPDVEQAEADEPDTIRSLEDSFDTILETTARDYGHAVRAVHAKGHGIIEATLTVAGGLPAEYAQGLFASSGTYRAWMRLSTNPGDILDDSIGLPRGVALKILDVPGDRLAGSEDAATQDFIMVNGPAFAAPTPKKFAGNLKLLSKTTDKAEWAKKAISTVFRGAEAVLEAAGTESTLLKTLGGAKNVHPLGETYFSQTPFRYGAHIAKFQLVPVSGDLTRHTDEVIDTAGRSDAIREDVAADMRETDATWELRVQLCRDLTRMPIEDASVVWSEEDSPFVTVATISARPQDSWSADKVAKVDEGMRFSVWTGIADHQPLGGVNRARRDTYRRSADFRARVNGCPLHEPA